jgi:pyruvate carboxylase subunit B
MAMRKFEVDPVGNIHLAAAPQPVAAAPASVPAAGEPLVKAPAPAPAPEPAHQGEGAVLVAPMPGMIVKYLVKAGDLVKQGDTIVILEAMKMENALAAPCDGKVQSIKSDSGDTVAKGAVLCVIA